MTVLAGALDFEGRGVDARNLQAMAVAVPFGGGSRVETWTSRQAGLALAHPRTGLGAGGGLLVRQGALALAGDLPSEPGGFGRSLVEGYAQSGPTALRQRAARELSGGFAVALVDEASGSLCLLRDRGGERSLYWTRFDGRVWFATEPAMLLALPGLCGKPDLTRMVAYLLARDASPERSFFKDLHRLPEGTMLVATARGERIEALPKPAMRRISPATAGRELVHGLASAVERRLPSSGETGILLSGGLDSATVACEAARALARARRCLHAFTWSSRRHGDLDERTVSSALIASFPNIVEHVIETDDLWPLCPGASRLEDESDPESNALPELLAVTVARARERDVVVLLNGTGGDAVVGWPMPDLALLASGRCRAAMGRWRRAGFIAAARGALSPLRRRRLPAWLTPEGCQIARDAGLDRAPVSLRDLLTARAFRRWLLAHSAVAATQERLDRWSRRSGVRLCAPWLDTDLLHLALRLPHGSLEVEGPGKSLVREAWKERLPNAVLANPTDKEAGMELLVRGLLDEGSARVRALFESSELERLGLISARAVLQQYSERAEQRGIMPGLWSMVTAEVWVRAQLGRGVAYSREQR